MVKEGVMDNPKIDAIFGIHINSQTPIGVIKYKTGSIMAASDDHSVTKVYDNKTMKNKHGGVILLGDHLYGHSDDVGWVCQELKTGDRTWREREALGKGSIVLQEGGYFVPLTLATMALGQHPDAAIGKNHLRGSGTSMAAALTPDELTAIFADITSAEATLTIDVTSVNDAPVAVDDTAATEIGRAAGRERV